ncbi:unnamed protein product [Hymenolepis diminuta]|nr:unnamed protein product [Hymenolepis diminuta]
MTFEWTSMQSPMIFNDPLDYISIEGDKCMAGEREIGSSCKNESEGKHLEIMVNDVTTGKALVIGSGKFFISFAPFIPKCEFEQPKEGYVDLETSFPFSRFVAGEKDIELKFAVGGANNGGGVKTKYLVFAKHLTNNTDFQNI